MTLFVSRNIRAPTSVGGGPMCFTQNNLLDIGRENGAALREMQRENFQLKEFLEVDTTSRFLKRSSHLIVSTCEQKVADAEFGLVKELMHSAIIFDGPQSARPQKCSSKWASTATKSVASP